MLWFMGFVMATVALMVGLPASMAGQAPTAAGSTSDPPPRAGGQPDIEGVWAIPGGALNYSIEADNAGRKVHATIIGLRSGNPGIVVDPPDGKIPYQPWAAAKRQDISDKHMDPPTIDYIDPVARGCFLEGVPRINYQGLSTVRIVQPPGYVVMEGAGRHLCETQGSHSRQRIQRTRAIGGIQWFWCEPLLNSLRGSLHACSPCMMA